MCECACGVLAPPCVRACVRACSPNRVFTNSHQNIVFTYQAVYGGVPTSPSEYPLCIGDAWMFYDDIIESQNITDIPQSVVVCPTNASADGQRYWTNNNLPPRDVSWSWHGIPNATRRPSSRPTFANNTWVEVIHERYPADEKTGAWFYYTKVRVMYVSCACPPPPYQKIEWLNKMYIWWLNKLYIWFVSREAASGLILARQFHFNHMAKRMCFSM